MTADRANPNAQNADYVLLRRSDVEALIEEYALDDDPFWKPLTHEELVELLTAAVHTFHGAESSSLQWAEHIAAYIDVSGVQSTAHSSTATPEQVFAYDNTEDS